MGLLLDTHVWIWSQAAPERLGDVSRSALVDPSEALFVATVSTLELARLVWGGRLEISGGLDDWLSASIELLAGRTIELSHAIAIEAYSLPGSFHCDPADRILVATARRHELTLVTADVRILAYPHVASLDART